MTSRISAPRPELVVAPPETQPPPRPSPFSLARCECVRCGAHANCRIGQMGASGMCSVCHGQELVPVEPTVRRLNGPG